jgi:hypothetical protein
MTPADDARPQFETAILEGSDSETPPGSLAFSCRGCQQTLSDEYFDVNGEPVCSSCRDSLLHQAEPPRGAMPLIRAALFGIAAAIAGAVLYYAVIAITNFEIGLVAIAIGYMVGYAIRKATGGRGGRVFQILALVLTYWSVGLAYVPLALTGSTQQPTASTPANATDAAPPAAAPPDTTAPARSADGKINLPIALAFLFVFSLALPVLAVFASLPGGLLSAVIIGVGMHQAWRMTAAPRLIVTGPLRVGTGAEPAIQG